MSDARIPVTVLTGWLGAGKTTLLNRILSQDHGRRYAVIVNEFGEIGIDHELIVRADEELFEMNNGCVCCTVRGDLIRTLHGLLDRAAVAQRAFDAIVVETTGLADPGPVAQTFFVDPFLLTRTRLDSITTVVDAAHVLHRLRESREAAEQIALADQIVVNKTDLFSAEQLRGVVSALRQLNPLAPLRHAQRCNVPLEQLLGLGGFDLQRITTLEPEFLNPPHGMAGHVHDEHCHHAVTQTLDPMRHDTSIRSLALRAEVPMDGQRVENWLTALVKSRGADILRAKGIIDIAGDDRRLVFQAVHMILEATWQRPWIEAEPRHSRLVFIGRDLDAAILQSEFDACRA
jgi:G3E family GTPase